MLYRKTLISAALLAFFLLPGAPPAQAALTYTQMAVQSADENFIRRVQVALLQDVNNGTTRMLAVPPLATDTTITAQRDRLARKIVADPHTWAISFAKLIALQLIAKTDLINETVTTDADLFAAENAVYDRYLPSP